MAKSPPDAVMIVEELSECLKTSRSTLCKLVQEGELSSQKIDQHWRFHRDAVDAWLKNQETNE